MTDNNESPIRRALPYFKAAGIVLALLLALWFGYVMRGPATPPSSDYGPNHGAEAESGQQQVWTCSMHPNIRQPKPGKCPICGMDLILVTPEEGNEDAGPRSLRMSKSARELLNIQISPVQRRFVNAEVRMVGKVEYDETKLAYLTAWVAGRLDRLFVDYTGIRVAKGDHMVSLFSPELLTAQQELFAASQAFSRVSEGSPETLKNSAKATVDAARRKLRLWGLAEAQIREAEQSGAFSDHVTIYAPIGGTVIERMGFEGMYVEMGDRIYTIADLSEVWVKLDAYESDLAWLHYGQKVSFATDACPGERFTGRIAFIDPVLNPVTRTVKVRVNVPNPEGKLKPEMFVRAVVLAQVAANGRVMDPELAGKWISPMHPEIVKDKPGTCDVCGMPLVRAEELGYVPAVASDNAKPLVIPASAPLITGKRAVVYVETPGTDRPTFEGREVVLGPRAGDEYIVESGLQEGEMVVTNGNFKIDSALQILAKPSMMNPEGGATPAVHEHGPANGAASTRPSGAAPDEGEAKNAPEAFQTQLRGVFDAYLELEDALASDELEKAAAAVKRVADMLAAVDMTLLGGEAHGRWMEHLQALQPALEEAGKASDIKALRTSFAKVSDALVKPVRAFGIGEGHPVYELHCPMAFENKGANWLQADKTVRNPYFGKSMLTCGEVVGLVTGPERDSGNE